MPELYYTAEEAMKLLNKSRTTFYREVETGEIPGEIEEGRKRGRKFPKEAIDALVNVIRRGNKTKLTFEQSTNSDLWMRVQNSRKIYGEEDIVSFKRVLEWKEINSEIFMSVKEGEKLVGAVTIMPLAESTIHALINGKIREQNIPDWGIKKWTEPGVSVYIPTIAVVSAGNPTVDTERGIFLIRNTIRWALELNKQYDIKNWYAIAAIEEGERLLQHLGFTYIGGKRKGYRLDDIKSASRLMKHFATEVETEDPGILLTHTSKSDTSVFERATEKDIVGISALGAELFGGESTARYPLRLAQYLANPDIFHVLKQGEQVIGYIGMFPLKKKAIDTIMAGMEEARFRTEVLSSENILQFKPGAADNVFLVIGVKQGLPQSKNYGFRVIHGSICVMEKLARQGIIIKKLYGTSRTQDGIRLATAIGFAQITLPNGEDDLHRFELDLETTPSKYFQKYQRLVKHKKSE